MSRHLQVLPVLRSTAAQLRQPAAGKENAGINVQTKRRPNRKSAKKGIAESDENCFGLKKEIEIGNESCETPKSDKNRIPKTEACPPAPRKPIRRIGVVSCKRKLMPELEYFEADRRKEVDEFFRSSFERISAANAKRKFGTSAAAADAVGVAASTCAVAAETSSSSSSSSPSPV